MIAAAFAAAGLLCGVGSGAYADPIPYSNPGTENPVGYTFTATTTGVVTAYFAGSHAAFHEELAIRDNTTATMSAFGLYDQFSSIGDHISLGVNAGDSLTFVLEVWDADTTTVTPDSLAPDGAPAKFLGDVYSDSSLNGCYDGPTCAGPGHNHIYSTVYAGPCCGLDALPNGIYVGFEDIPAVSWPAGYSPNWNYTDEQFVFTDTAVPEPLTIALFGAGLAGAVAMRRRKKKTA